MLTHGNRFIIIRENFNSGWLRWLCYHPPSWATRIASPVSIAGDQEPASIPAIIEAVLLGPLSPTRLNDVEHLLTNQASEGE
jgi:hypothetical protein